MTSQQNSASHWCKSVIEEAISSPSALNSASSCSIQSMSPSDISNGLAINPAYMMVYQQYYQNLAASAAASRYIPLIMLRFFVLFIIIIF
jgi:hypothetical protein